MTRDDLIRFTDDAMWQDGRPSEKLLAALDAAGLVIVPLDPTGEQLYAAPSRDQSAEIKDGGSMYGSIYRAMVSASPFAPSAKETKGTNPAEGR